VNGESDAASRPWDSSTFSASAKSLSTILQAPLSTNCSAQPFCQSKSIFDVSLCPDEILGQTSHLQVFNNY